MSRLTLTLYCCVALLTLAGLAAAYPVDRMVAFQEAPRVVVVCPPELRGAAVAFAERFARRRGRPVEVADVEPADSQEPRIVLTWPLRAPARTGIPVTITISEHRIELRGSREAIEWKLQGLSGPPLAAGGDWVEASFDHEGGRIGVRYRAGSLVAGELPGFARARAADRDRIAAAIGLGDKPPGGVTYVLYETYEEKGLATKSLLDAHVDVADGTIHAVHGWDARGDDGRALASLLLQRHAGQPATRWLEVGLPLALAGTPAPHDAITRATRLAVAGELLGRELENPETWKLTSHRLTDPAAAALARELLARIAPREVRAVWARSRPQRKDLDELHAAALARLLADRAALAKLDQRTRLAAAAFATGGQRGFCYAHEGYRIHNGYVGATSEASLDQLARTGCNWISITPFLGFSSTTSPQLGNVNRSSPGGETDEQVIQAATYARRCGMNVFLKPHLWSHAGWCGDLAMQSEADWRRFFRNYSDFVLHYALMAAENGFAAFSLGNEMPGTTLSRAADWRRLIARVRRVYPGQLLYCANWNVEFERLPFWDAVDACAVSCYFPLSGSAAPSDQELRAGARAVVQRLEAVARRTGKPVVISELGYAPFEGAWRAPYQERGLGAFSPAAQERCFQAMLGALGTREWCLGTYIWKWPSFTGYAGAGHRGFSPLGKPAMKVIQAFFDGK